MSLLIFYLLLAIGVSFLCSILEAVLLSLNDSYIAMLESDGESHGKALRELKSNIDKPLATILSLNTIAHTVGAAGVGAQAASVFGEAYLGLISAVLTLLILVFSEIIPKTLGARYWRQLSHITYKILRVLVILLRPLVWFCEKITGLISNRESVLDEFSREEFAAMADRGVEQGVFQESDVSALKNFVFFESLRAADVMTPRPVIQSLDSQLTINKVMNQVERMPFSRFPIYNKHSEDICGYVLKTDIFLAVAKGNGDQQLDDIKRTIFVVEKSVSLKDCFDQLNQRREHLALLVDEYGGVSGIVTMEDIIETILGYEIMDEVDTIEDMQNYARKQWIKRAERVEGNWLLSDAADQ
ncbi:CNNM domain-containing protein [Aliikangiella sp. IMCC44653]